MDAWKPGQIEAMRKGGGNDRCREFMVARSGGTMSSSSSVGYGAVSVREKYDSPYGQLWQQIIKARVEGREEPTELPEPMPKSNTDRNNGNTNENDNYNNSATRIKMEGFGSSPHPSERKLSRKKKGGRLLGAGAAAMGAIGIAAVGLAARSRRGNRNSNHNHKGGVSRSTRV
jgi:hypothetical protein